MSMSGRARRSAALRRRSARWLVMIVALLIVATACSSGSGGSGSGSGSSKGSQDGNDSGYVGSDHQLTTIKPDKRKPAPDISGPSLKGKKSIHLDDYKGKVVVVNVWGSWCAPCRNEAPDLRAAAKKTSGTAHFLGIDSRDPGKAAPRAFVRSYKMTYPSIYDPDGSQVVRFTKVPPSAIPATLVIDRQGRVAARVLGTVTRSTLVGMVKDVANGK